MVSERLTWKQICDGHANRFVYLVDIEHGCGDEIVSARVAGDALSSEVASIDDFEALWRARTVALGHVSGELIYLQVRSPRVVVRDAGTEQLRARW